LQAQINKTDRNDARGIAQMMRVRLYRSVHVKTPRSQKLRTLLTHRKLLQSKALAIETDLRGTLRNFGLKVGMVGTVKFEARLKELVENLPALAVLVEPLLIVRRVLREQLGILHRRLLAIVRDDEVCRRLMTVPGVGPVVALTYRATVDVPARFRNSKAVGAVFGLTPSEDQSGESNRTGAISRCGDEMMRVMLYEAAQSMLTRTNKWSWLKAWAMKIARHRGMKKAIVALARRLAVIMHRIWVDGTEFSWIREIAAA
jgi:transposase